MPPPLHAGGLRAITRRGLAGLKWRVLSAMDRLALSRELPPRMADSFRRSSRYVTVRDGTRIAVDLYRPTLRGVELPGPYPAVWTQERYHRARFERGRLVTRLDTEPWLQLLIRLGYVVAVADLRGSGASFGSRDTLILEEDRWDAWDVTEWLAARPWSNGRVGMFGKSFMGITQFLAASTAPPHLAAILPEKTLFDLYAFARPGGIFRDDYGAAWSSNITDLDTVRPAAPVDEDADGSLLARAMEEHRANCDVFDVFEGLRFRDSELEGRLLYRVQSPAERLDEIARSGVAVFQLAGWHDMWPRDALLWHHNLPNPRRLVIGPWPHTHDGGWKLFMERLRWYDHWLKERDNGVMDGPAIRYYTVGAARGRRWRSASSWPPRGVRATEYWLHPASAGSFPGGSLAPEGPPDRDDSNRWTVDYAATSGRGSRWRNGYGLEFGYPDMAANDARGMAYTTAPLVRDLEVTGHPVVTLWVSCSAGDVDLFVYLEEVWSSGRSEYVTEGALRASHRALGEPAHDHLGLPWHGSRKDEVEALGDDPVELVLDLHPVSRVFRKGRRIRVALAGADADNMRTPRREPPPAVIVHTGPTRPSRIVLPAVRSA